MVRVGDDLTTADSDDFYFDGDFTIDFWINFNSINSDATIYAQRADLNNRLVLYLSSNGAINLRADSGGTNLFLLSKPVTFTTGGWHHIAAVRNGNDYYLCYDGSCSSYTDSDALPNISVPVHIGSNGAGGNYLNGWLDEVRVSKGIARWTGDFTPPASEYFITPPTPVITNTPTQTQAPTDTPMPGGADPYAKALLHMNGQDGSTSFADATGRTWTANGDAQIDSSQSKFGGASGLFDGSGDDLSTADSNDFYFDGDFTIDFWINFNSLASDATIYAQRVDANDRFVLVLSSYGVIELRADSGGSNLFYFTKPVTFALNEWHHIAAVRSGNDYYLCYDGSCSTYNDTDALPNYSVPVHVASNGTGGNFLNGWLDEVRISKGIARWTGDFTPPTEEHSLTLPVPTATPTITPTPVSSGAFPSTVVLDDFNRADGSLGNNWWEGSTTFTISSDQLNVVGGDPATWQKRSFGANQEAYVTLTSVDPDGGEQDLLLKAQDTTPWSGVIEVLYEASKSTVTVWTTEADKVGSSTALRSRSHSRMEMYLVRARWQMAPWKCIATVS
jgi:hypothetical protein